MVAPELADFDLFCFEDEDGSMSGILASPLVTLTDAGGQFELDYPSPPGTSNDLAILSGDTGGGFPTDNAIISIEPADGMPQSWTVEFSVTFEELPPDFSDLVNRHVFIGGSDSAGPIGGIFISQVGLQYAGAIHHPGGSLVVDTPITPIPDSSQYIELDAKTVFRLVADGINEIFYLYVTPAADVAVTGHRLIAILPVIDSDAATFPAVDQVIASVRGTTPTPSRLIFDNVAAASSALIANLPPVAKAGADQAVTFCSVARFDGSASFDPEGETVSFLWRLVGAPDVSTFTISGTDGRTYPLLSPTGFTDRFHSTSLGLAHASDPLQTGDVLLVDSLTYHIDSTGTDINGFYALVDDEAIPDNLPLQSYRVFRQRGISGKETARPTFLGDVPGFYRMELTVNDGLLDSVPSVVVVNVVDSALPRGIIPNADFIFDYLSDYWSLIEDPGAITTFWSGLAQVASSELLTLWQHDYSKSLRDIQRTFLRRWLHYDLLLAEPIPDLTTIRVFYGGLSTSAMDPGGVGGISGTSFVIGSLIHPNRTITVLSSNPVKAETLVVELRNRLLEADPRYTTQLIKRTDGDEHVRINAPFPFTIVSSSLPVLSIGVSDFAGGTGEVIGPRIYKVNFSLEGLGIQEDDLLVLDTESFRISQIVDDASDQYRFQRLVTKSDIDAVSVSAWVICGYVHSEVLDFYNGLVSAEDVVVFEVTGVGDADVATDTDSLVETSALGVASDAVSNLGFRVTPALAAAIAQPDLYNVRLAKVIRKTYLPIDESIVDIPTLVELIEIQDDQATLRRNLDFFIEEYRGRKAIRFVSDQDADQNVWESETPPDRIWAEHTYLDNNPTIEANFGILAEVSIDQISALPGNVDYLSAVRGIWYAYVNGPTLFNLRVGAQILLGLPFAEEAGTIEEIRTDFSPTTGRILIRDSERTEIVRSYTFPRDLDLEENPATGELYAEGDVVKQFAPLVEGVEIVDYVKDPRWFEGLLNQGIFYEPEKYWQFLVRVDSTVFGLDPLLFVQNFILKVKPTATYPYFLVSSTVGDTEISVTDTIETDVTLEMSDGICGSVPSALVIDDARPGGGGYWNKVDEDSDEVSPPPTFPVADAPIEWGVDKFVLCPSSTLSAHVCEVFAAPFTPTVDSVFIVDESMMNDARFVEAGPIVVANGATGESITVDVGDTVPQDGTITKVRVLLTGGPGADPAGYEVVVAVNGVDQIVEAFTSTAVSTNFSATVSEAVLAGDVITARIRHGGGAPRSPAWTNVRVDVSVDMGPWAVDDVLDPGNYCGERTLVDGPGVFTDHGREWLAQLISLSSMDPDVPTTTQGIKYMQFGVGGDLAGALPSDVNTAYPAGEDPNASAGNEYDCENPTIPPISTLERPVRLSGTDNPYSSADPADVWLTSTTPPKWSALAAGSSLTFRFFISGSAGDIIYAPFTSVPISEAGLVLSGDADINEAYNLVAAYLNFSPITLTATTEVEMEWTVSL